MLEDAIEEEPSLEKASTSTFNFRAYILWMKKIHSKLNCIFPAPDLTRERNFNCAMCAKNIGTRGGLLYHIKAHIHGRPYKCDVCNRSYATKNDFETHYKRHAGYIFTCDFCSKQFPVKEYLLVHLRAKHFPKVLPCTDCKKTKYFTCKEDLKRHYAANKARILAKINLRWKFKCKLCKARFSHLKEYTKHCNNRELLKFKCATCFKKFGCQKLYLEHMREERKAGFCEICKTNVKSFKAHFDSLHKKNVCRVCKVFESPICSEFRKHIKSCGTNAQLQALGNSCTICKQSFRHIITLNKHLNSNHANVWCPKCSRGFHSEHLLKVHSRMHKSKKKGKVQYACILCVPNKNFFNKKNFNSHFETHHGAGKKVMRKKFNCHGCRGPPDVRYARIKRTNKKDEFVKHIYKCLKL
jgi:KRAB domain-containing zinc finger protein